MKKYKMTKVVGMVLLSVFACNACAQTHQEEKAILVKAKRIAEDYYTGRDLREVWDETQWMEKPETWKRIYYELYAANGFDYEGAERSLDSLYEYQWVKTVRYKDLLDVEYYWFVSEWKGYYQTMGFSYDPINDEIEEKNFHLTYLSSSYNLKMILEKELKYIDYLKAKIEKKDRYRLENIKLMKALEQLENK